MSRDRNRRSDASGPKPIGSFGDQDRKRVLDYLSSRSLGEDIALQETCRRIACRTTTMRSLQFSSKCQSERRIHLRRLLPLRGFQIDREVAEDFLPRLKEYQRPLASHLIHRLQGKKRPILTSDFFTSLSGRTLPTPAEMSDNLPQLIAERVEGRPGRPISIDHNELSIAASIGAVDGEDVLWVTNNLEAQGWLTDGKRLNFYTNGTLSVTGWARVEELKRAHVASRYAFFARKFANADLDTLYKDCLRQAVADTGFELRTVTQKAGHID